MRRNREPSLDRVVALWDAAKRVWVRMDHSYNKLSAVVRDHPRAMKTIEEAQAAADDIGRQYESLCDRICNADARTLEGVLAKLECATQCIRDIIPEGTDPERACDIELRFVFSVERDVGRLVAEARRSGSSRRRDVTPKNRETTPGVSARRPLGDVGTVTGRVR